MRATLRILMAYSYVGAATLVTAPLQWLALKTGFMPRAYFTKLWHRSILQALGIRVQVVGQMSAERPLLIAANHISWTDIMVLGAVADVVFIAKSEVKKWPLLGPLSRLQRTVFVEREKRRRTGEQASDIAARLAAGDAMVLFAEGTTADGNLMLPFKSSLFGAADLALLEGTADTVWVQPLAIAYTRFHGMAMGRHRRTTTAWIGDASLTSHIRLLLGEGPLDAELRFGEPIPFRAGESRKELARAAEDRVRELAAAAKRAPLPCR